MANNTEELKSWIRINEGCWMNIEPGYKCPHCGVEKHSKTRFCPSCGNELNLAKDSRIYTTTTGGTVVI